MTPPINIDGTDITGGTIDGTDFSEVTVDGTTVLSTIPDAVDDRWKLSEGSGTFVANSIGTIDMSLSSNTMWVSNSKYTEGNAVENTDEDSFTVSSIDLNGSQASICLWTDSVSNINGGFGRLLSVSPQAPNSPDDGYELLIDGGSLIGQAFENGSGNQAFNSTVTASFDTDDYFLCLRVDGDTIGLRIYDGSGSKTDDLSGTASRGQTADTNVEGLSVDYESDVGGIADDVFAARGSTLTESEEKELASKGSR